jgi:hypothetical protein
VIEPKVRVLERDDLRPAQKREIAEKLSLPGTFTILVENVVDGDGEGNHRLRTSVTVEKYLQRSINRSVKCVRSFVVSNFVATSGAGSHLFH